MEVILKEDVTNLGYKNDIVKVKEGYGRNYLIPQGKAVIATESAKKVLAENERQRAHKLAKIKADAEALAAKLSGVALTISAKVSEAGTIFGGVGAAQIVEELAKLGFEVDRKIIAVETVKELGSYTAVVNVMRDVKAEIPFEVVAEVAE
ncbi:MAG: 50S ribosomal protein L9 [Bacteroidaceae bacterium]|nr:50S ribosomal protein L9 [Bacteroidaceae bacterium]